jgi:hypothetical protein
MCFVLEWVLSHEVAAEPLENELEAYACEEALAA